MRILIQRVTSARVLVGGEVVGSTGPGLCTFVGVTHEDSPAVAERAARRLWGLRVFEDEAGLINRSAEDLGPSFLVVSQFTLYADTSKGRRPSFVAAAPPEQAQPLVDAVATELRRLGAQVGTGIFGAKMTVELVNDGPFTLMLEF